jgi:cell division initiation protein
MAITPLDIRKKTFASQLRGFSPNEVRTFLQLVATELEELRKERSLLAEKLDEVTARVETYQRTEQLLHETLLTAQKATDELRDDARRQAELVVEQARLEVQRERAEHDERMAELRERLRELETLRSNLIDEISGIARTYIAMAERQSKERPKGEPADTAEPPSDTQ